MSNLADSALRAYADIAVQVGVNLQPGQHLVLRADLRTAPLAREITRSAYQAGARYVHVFYDDESLVLARFEHAPRDSFAEFPDWRVRAQTELIDAGAALISIASGDPDLLLGQDQNLISLAQETAAHRSQPIGLSHLGSRQKLVHALRSSAYEVVATVEQRALHRLATVRLRPRGVSQVGPVIDLLFASSGIEAETVRDAEALEVFPDVMVPVARTPHLVAMKLLARDDRKRPQDWDDLRALLEGASPADIARTRELVALIEQRGAHRGRNLADALNELIAASGPAGD